MTDGYGTGERRDALERCCTGDASRRNGHHASCEYANKVTTRTDGRGRTVVVYGMEDHCPVPDCDRSGKQTHEHTYGLGEKSQREGDQPPPILNASRDIQSLVIEDMEARRALGIKRYGTALKAHNGRDALVDLYEELLDAVMYAKQAIVERDSHVAQAPGQQSGNH